jgi:hypothetical protein
MSPIYNTIGTVVRPYRCSLGRGSCVESYGTERKQSEGRAIVRHDNYSRHKTCFSLSSTHPYHSDIQTLSHRILLHTDTHTLLHIYTHSSKMPPSSLIGVRGALRNTFQATIARSSSPRASQLLVSPRLQSTRSLRFRTVRVLHSKYITYRIIGVLTISLHQLVPDCYMLVLIQPSSTTPRNPTPPTFRISLTTA